MHVGSNSSTNIAFAVAKKSLEGTREQGKQALELISGVTTTNQANGPQRTSGLNLVA